MKEVPINVMLGKNQVICDHHGLFMSQEWLLLLRQSLDARSDVACLHLPFLGYLGVEAQPRGATLGDVWDEIVAGNISRCSLLFWQQRLAVND